MKEVPRGAVLLILALATLLLAYLVWEMRNNSYIQESNRTLDELEIKTDNPQEAGKNITP